MNFKMMNGLKFGNPYFSVCVWHNLTQRKLLHQIDWSEVRQTRIKSDIDPTCDRNRLASATFEHTFQLCYALFICFTVLILFSGTDRLGSIPAVNEETYRWSVSCKEYIRIFVIYCDLYLKKIIFGFPDLHLCISF